MKTETNPLWIWLAGLLVLIPGIWGVIHHFQIYDRRSLNVHQPIQKGQVIFGGALRIKTLVHGSSPFNYFGNRFFRRRFYRPVVPHAPDAKKRVKMVTRTQEYIYRGIQGKFLEVDDHLRDSKGQDQVKTIKLDLHQDVAILTVPEIAEPKQFPGKTFLLRLTAAGLTVKERVSR